MSLLTNNYANNQFSPTIITNQPITSTVFCTGSQLITMQLEYTQ